MDCVFLKSKVAKTPSIAVKTAMVCLFTSVQSRGIEGSRVAARIICVPKRCSPQKSNSAKISVRYRLLPGCVYQGSLTTAHRLRHYQSQSSQEPLRYLLFCSIQFHLPNGYLDLLPARYKVFQAKVRPLFQW